MPPEAELDGTWCRRVKPLRVQSRRRRSCSDIPSPVVDNLDRRKGRPIVDRRGSEPTHDESKLVALDAHDANPPPRSSLMTGSTLCRSAPTDGSGGKSGGKFPAATRVR